MSKSTWYSVRADGLASWIVTKFEGTAVPTAYHVALLAGGLLTCDCFAGNRESCRHRRMIGLFDKAPSGALYNFDLALWQEPNEEGV